MLKPLNVCKVYLQCGIVIQRVVTKHGLPRVQLSRMMTLKIEFAKNKCLYRLRLTQLHELIQQEHYKKRLFLVTLPFDPHLVHDRFL